LFVFVILLLLGIVFFIRYQEASISQEAKTFQKEHFNLLISILPRSPEVVCSSYTKVGPCLDSTKLTSFSILAKREEGLFSEYGFKTITVKSLYPVKNTRPCTFTNSQDCGVWTLYDKKPSREDSTALTTVTPISLYNPLTKKYSIGIFIVEGYNL